MSGREIDAEVAEKVMGWKKDTERLDDYYNDIWITHYVKDTKGRDCPVRVDLPAFSTDIAASFQMVEKMRELGFGFELTMHENQSSSIAAKFWMTIFDIEEIELGRSGDEPEAICKCALFAIEKYNVALSALKPQAKERT